ncbi:hypothetical protein L1765_11085 [Microaerobacter geothermalis]|uniref:hypothetical protein n=1 Tax=Microaerobacter geothermalis TaxID=674972 RepID=UPI001F24D076|nr:hypothetical protein [Microaerobacter geothermalis]MCF6094507.1 hypothetical protein [Microaerobacter geothermalis]
MDFWTLGFLWGCGRISGDYFLVQSKYKQYVKKVRDVADPKRSLFPVERYAGESWRLKLPLSNPYVQWMFSHGYEGRIGNTQRRIPEFDSVEREAEFLRGYFSIHYTFDTFVNKKRVVPRLRFFATEMILERLNQHLHGQVGTTLKKVQKHSKNDVCHVLYYTSKREVPVIIEYLYLFTPDNPIPGEKTGLTIASCDVRRAGRDKG